jgi:HlyD family secretion protein
VIDSIAVSAKVAKGAQGLSFAVKIRLEKTEGVVLRPGMSCRAEIFTEIVDGILAVPIQAVLIDEDRRVSQTRYHVFLHEDGVVREAKVTIGLSDDTYQEITDGLSEGDVVIIGPDRVLRDLEDGDNVTASVSE